ncbi:hypothetical protein OIU84_012477 [Salix udensis]|uniref:Uncharacterized protein n=1 Tax=Salix udensis TaxID=889485 RepID=A0AAD6JFS3_9ROSI|nr:hypothetical protein OIU84_012477 [Salix udensis]
MKTSQDWSLQNPQPYSNPSTQLMLLTMMKSLNQYRLINLPIHHKSYSHPRRLNSSCHAVSPSAAGADSLPQDHGIQSPMLHAMPRNQSRRSRSLQC